MISTLKRIRDHRRGHDHHKVKPIDDGRRDFRVENLDQLVTDGVPTTTTTTTTSSSMYFMTEDDLSEILSRFEAFAASRNQVKCLELVHKIMGLGKGSERNRKWFVENGAARLLAGAFSVFATCSTFEEEREQEHNYMYAKRSILEALLSALNWLFPLPKNDHTEAFRIMGSTPSLRCILWFLKQGDPSSKRNAILLLKELVRLSIDDPHYAGHQQIKARLYQLKGLDVILFNLIKEYNSSTISRPALQIVFHLLNSEDEELRFTTSFANMGLIDLLLEVTANSVSSRSICEKALGIIDTMCRNCEKGRRDAYSNALTVPVLVKKILRVSPIATDFSVSTLWNISRTDREENSKTVSDIATEALRVGAFQKLLLVIQIGCTDATKEQATYLLKLLNSYRQKDGIECVDSGDLKNLKRTF